MKFPAVVLTTLLVVIAAIAPIASADSAVVTLTETTFDQETQDHVWFIKFYAPWCGHCKKIAPVLDQLSIDPKITGTDVRIGKVDCTKERGLCERFSVQSYPTLKVVTGGRYYEYEDRREVGAMANFALTGYKDGYAEKVPSLSEIAAQKAQAAAEQADAERTSAVVAISSTSFEDLVIKGSSPWILKFYAPWCGHCKRLAPTWHRLSKALQDKGSNTRVGKVDCTVHRRVCSRFDVNGYPTLLYVRDGVVYKYQGARNLNAFVDFVESGWESSTSLGAIPDETFLSSIVDQAVEWAAEHTVLAIIAGILIIAILVAILVALLDYCMGDDDVNAYRQIPRGESDGPRVTQQPNVATTKPKEE